MVDSSPKFPASLLLLSQVQPLPFITVEDLRNVFVFHKPGLTAHSAKGYVSHFSTASARHEGFSLRDYFSQAGLDKQYPPDEMICFGRLDRDTSGLLVLAKRNLHPKFIDQVLLNPNFKKTGPKVTKVYCAKVKGQIDAEKLSRVRSLQIPGANEVPVEVRVESARVLSVVKEEHLLLSSFVEMEVNEGKHHQVKKMFYALGHPVRLGGLHRTRFGFLTLASAPDPGSAEMETGSIRALFPAEKEGLVELYNEWLGLMRKEHQI